MPLTGTEAREQRLGDLHRVEGGAFPQVVGHDPEAERPRNGAALNAVQIAERI